MINIYMIFILEIYFFKCFEQLLKSYLILIGYYRTRYSNAHTSFLSLSVLLGLFRLRQRITCTILVFCMSDRVISCSTALY